MKFAQTFFATAAVLAGLVVVAQAGHCCRSCNSCGGHKVCRLVPDVTKVTTYKYCLECEDFCVHGRSKCVGTQQVCDCRGCCKCEKVMQPTCACVKTKAKLVKIPVVKEKCGWKCVVVHVCNGCRQCAEARPATDVELQMALQTAEQQGIILTSASEPFEVMIPADEPAQLPSAAPEAAKPILTLQKIGSFFSK